MGIIEGIAEATASLLKLFSGVVVDRTRRARPWLLFGLFVAYGVFIAATEGALSAALLLPLWVLPQG